MQQPQRPGNALLEAMTSQWFLLNSQKESEFWADSWPLLTQENLPFLLGGNLKDLHIKKSQGMGCLGTKRENTVKPLHLAIEHHFS